MNYRAAEALGQIMSEEYATIMKKKREADDIPVPPVGDGDDNKLARLLKALLNELN